MTWGCGVQSGSSRLLTWLGAPRAGILRSERARWGPRRVLLLDFGKKFPLVTVAALPAIPGQADARPPDQEKERRPLGVRSDVWEVSLGFSI